jgi:hypothetical protein
VDISGHPPFPTVSKQFSHNFGNLLFLAVFNFRGHFEGLNEGFLGSSFSMIIEGSNLSPKMNILENTFPTSYCAPQTEIVCQSYAHGKLIHQTTQNGVHKTIGFLIQVDIGGHPPIPLGPTTLFLSVFQFP